MKYFLFVFLLVFINIYAVQSTEVSSPFPFNALNGDAKGISMGKSYYAMTKDVYSVFWNPAGLSYIENLQIGISASQYALNRKSIFAAIAFPLYSKEGEITYLPNGETQIGSDIDFIMAVSNSLFFSPDIVSYTEDLQSYTYDFIANTAIISLAIKRDLFSFGINVKGFYQEIDKHKYYGIGTDIGVQMTVFTGVKTAIVGQDLVSLISRENDPKHYDLLEPHTITSVSITVPPGLISVSFSMDTNVRQAKSIGNWGIEFSALKRTTIRGGLANNKFTIGFTFAPTPNLEFSYAMLIEKHLSEDNNHIFSIKAEF